jgi:hypothetical protein
MQDLVSTAATGMPVVAAHPNGSGLGDPERDAKRIAAAHRADHTPSSCRARTITLEL